MEVAALGFRIDSTPAARAATDLERMASATGKADAAVSGINQSSSRATKSLDDFDRSAKRSSTSVADLAMSVTRLGQVIGVSLGVREIVNAADAWTGLQNRLRLVTNSAEDLAKATGDVYRIAQATSSGIDSVAQVYQRFAQNADRLGLSLEQVASLSDTVGKAVAISGSSAAAADAALMQFGQALASGVFRGEEFNSVNEQANGIIQALAIGLGVTTGELRVMAAEGKITADVLVRGLTNARDAVDERFDTRVKTVSQSMTELNNAFIKIVGDANNFTGATTHMADAISALARNLDVAAVAVGTLIASRVGPWAIARSVEFARLALSANAASTAMVRLRTSALALAGGPVGAVITAIGIATTAWMLFGRESKTALDAATRGVLETNDGLDVMIERFNELNRVQQTLAIGEKEQELADASRQAVQALDELLDKVAVVEGTRAAPRIRQAFSEQLQGIVTDTELTSSQVAEAVMNLVSTFTSNANLTREYKTALLENVQAYINARTAAGEYSAQLDAMRAAVEQARASVNGMTVDLDDQAAALAEFMKTYATNSERAAAEIEKWSAALGGLTDEQRQRILDRFADRTRRATREISEAEKATQAFNREREQYLYSLYEEITALDAQARELDLQNEYYGLSESAIQALTIARLEEQAAMLAGFSGSEQAIELIELEIAARERLRAATQVMETRRRNEQAEAEFKRLEERRFEEAQRTNDAIANSLTDALMRGFEGGASFAENFRRTIINMFRTMVLRPMIQPIMSQAAGFLTGGMGGGGGIGGIGGGGLPPGTGNLFSMAGNFLTNASLTTGASVGSIGLANMVGAAGGDAIGALIAGNAGWTTASGALGAAGSVMSAIGAAAPYIGIGLMAYSMLKDAFDGETRFGAGYTIGADTGFSAVRTGGPSGGDQSATQTMAAIEETFRSTERLANLLGGSVSGLQLGAGLEISPDKGRSFVWSDWAGAEGVSHERGKLDLSGVTDGNVVAQEFSIELQRAIIRGLQMSEVDDHWREWINQFDVSALDETGVQNVIATIDALVKLRDAAINMGMESLANASAQAQANIIALSGGIDGFTTNLGTYYQAFYTEAERTAHLQTTLTKAMQDMGMELPKTHAAFRALVDAQDLTTESGQQTYATLLSISGAFDQLVTSLDGLGGSIDATFNAQLEAVKSLAAETNRLLGSRNRAGTVLGQIDRAMGRADGFSAQREAELWSAMATASYEQQIELAQELTNIVMQRYEDEIASAEQLRDLGRSLREYVQSLTIGELSPLTLGEKLAEAGADYATTLAMAQAGDTGAMGRLQGAADAYLRLARDYYASSDEYTRIFDYVTGSLDTLGVQAMSDAERQLSVSEDSLSQLEELRGVAQRAFNVLDAQYKTSLDMLHAETLALAQIGADTGRLHDIAALLANLPAELAARLQGIIGGAAGGVVGGWYGDAGFSDQVGLDYWSGQLQQKPQDQVRKDFLHSMVQNWYSDYLGWSPDQEAIDYWSAAISQLGAQQAFGDFARTAGLPGYANGGFASGLAIVGERGPEIVDFSNSPGRVYTNSQLSSAMSMGQQSAEEIRALRKELAEQSKMLAAVIAQSSQANAERVSGAVENTATRSTWNEQQKRYATT